MNARTILVICIVLLASLVVFRSTANVQKSRAASEYKVLENSFNETQMNALGAEGWELVAIGVVEGFPSTFAFFKRQK